MVHQLCGVGKAVMQGSSQAAMLWHLRQFESPCADKRDMTFLVK